MRLRSLSSLAILILISSCNIPTPPPNPPEPPPECLPNLPWCHETNPPMHCGDCKTNPSTDPNYCEKAPDCPPEDPCANITCVPGYHCEDGNCVQDPVIPPNPPANNCPKALAPDSVVYMAENYYGQGIDSTVRVRGDSEFCFLIHGVHTDDCHLEGWPKRAECEMELIFGCPVWEFSVDNGATVHFCNDNHDALASCDHFGNTIYRDDPQTPDVFEGRPPECGLQRDEFGPNAGFFVIAHGNGLIRACKPDRVASTCGPWKVFNH